MTEKAEGGRARGVRPPAFRRAFKRVIGVAPGAIRKSSDTETVH